MISEESLEKFKELYKKEFGEEKSNSSRELFFFVFLVYNKLMVKIVINKGRAIFYFYNKNK